MNWHNIKKTKGAFRSGFGELVHCYLNNIEIRTARIQDNYVILVGPKECEEARLEVLVT